MEPHTAGDPMGKLLKWSRKSPYSVSKTLKNNDVNISAATVGSILKDMKYSLKSNRKSISLTQHPERDRQFKYIECKVNEFKDIGQPVISVDTKKKEKIGNFSNDGKKYCIEPEHTLDHDFITHAIGKLNPYGIYEKLVNKGTVVCGTSGDTPEFAVDSIVTWMTNVAYKRYSNIYKLLILCDCGGSNGYRIYGWKYYLYMKLASIYGINVQVCHYPAGASKWNPIEHRMFSFIQKNWKGEPLRTYDIAMNFIQHTTTSTGLEIQTFLNRKEYKTGIKFKKEEVENKIKIIRDSVLPNWNYSILP